MSLWMRNNINQKGTNKIDLVVIYDWGRTKSETKPIIGCGMVPVGMATELVVNHEETY